MDKSGFLSLAKSASFESAVSSIIGRTCLIEFGIIKEFAKDESGEDIEDIVHVLVSVAKERKDARLYTCRLVNLTGTSLYVNTKAKVDDKVIVVFPRRYDEAMFLKENNEALVNSESRSYSPFCGIAFLANRYSEEEYRNFIEENEGEVTLNLAYSEEDEKNLLVIQTKNDGSVSLENKASKTEIGADGTLKFSNMDSDGNAVVSLSASSEGSITIDNAKATVSIDSEGNISIDSKGGKLTLKNNSASLFDILNGMLTILNSSLATAGSPASHTVVPNQFSQQTTALGNLMQ